MASGIRRVDRPAFHQEAGARVDLRKECADLRADLLVRQRFCARSSHRKSVPWVRAADPSVVDRPTISDHVELFTVHDESDYFDHDAMVSLTVETRTMKDPQPSALRPAHPAQARTALAPTAGAIDNWLSRRLPLRAGASRTDHDVAL